MLQLRRVLGSVRDSKACFSPPHGRIVLVQTAQCDTHDAGELWFATWSGLRGLLQARSKWTCAQDASSLLALIASATKRPERVTVGTRTLASRTRHQIGASFTRKACGSRALRFRTPEREYAYTIDVNVTPCLCNLFAEWHVKEQCLLGVLDPERLRRAVLSPIYLTLYVATQGPAFHALRTWRCSLRVSSGTVLAFPRMLLIAYALPSWLPVTSCTRDCFRPPTRPAPVQPAPPLPLAPALTGAGEEVWLCNDLSTAPPPSCPALVASTSSANEARFS